MGKRTPCPISIFLALDLATWWDFLDLELVVLVSDGRWTFDICDRAQLWVVELTLYSCCLWLRVLWLPWLRRWRRWYRNIEKILGLGLDLARFFHTLAASLLWPRLSFRRPCHRSTVDIRNRVRRWWAWGGYLAIVAQYSVPDIFDAFWWLEVCSDDVDFWNEPRRIFMSIRTRKCVEIISCVLWKATHREPPFLIILLGASCTTLQNCTELLAKHQPWDAVKRDDYYSHFLP